MRRAIILDDPSVDVVSMQNCFSLIKVLIKPLHLCTSSRSKHQALDGRQKGFVPPCTHGSFDAVAWKNTYIFQVRAILPSLLNSAKYGVTGVLWLWKKIVRRSGAEGTGERDMERSHDELSGGTHGHSL